MKIGMVSEFYYPQPGGISEHVRATACELEALGHEVVVLTSDMCYENNEWVWGYRENDRLGGHDPYSTSKAAAELVVAAYRDCYLPVGDHGRHGVAVASARAGNVIGGGDWAEDRLVPDIATAMLGRRPVKIRNPHAIRPWQFVLEPLSGYLLLAGELHADRW